LQHDGDSVVSLRFVYQEVPSGRYEDVDNAPETEARSAEAVLGELRAIGNFVDAEGGYDDPAEIALLIQELRSDHPDAQLSAADQAMVDNLTVYAVVDDVQNNAFERDRAEREANEKRADVETTSRAEMAELADSVTAEKLARDAERPPQHELDQPVVRVAAKVSELPATLDQAVARVEDDIAERFGDSAFAGFNPDQFA